MKPSRDQQGFTLIEVLVALVIITIAFMGVIVALGNGIRFTSKIRDGMAAYWIAENQTTGLQLNLIKDADLTSGYNNLNMMNQAWLVKIDTQKTATMIKKTQVYVYRAGHNNKPKGSVIAAIHATYLRDLNTN